MNVFMCDFYFVVDYSLVLKLSASKRVPITEAEAMSLKWFDWLSNSLKFKDIQFTII